MKDCVNSAGHAPGDECSSNTESANAAEDAVLSAKGAKAVPRVSIGLPVSNGENFLQQALDSILGQTFKDFEVIISDNGSTDGTEEICKAYTTRDPRIRYYRNDINRGGAWNSNRVFELARGEYFKWWHHDDLCAPEFLARCVAALDHNPAAIMACTDIVIINKRGEGVGPGVIPAELASAKAHVRFCRNIRTDHPCQHIHSLIRSHVLRQTVLIANYNDSDRVLLAHLSLFGHCELMREPLLFIRDHPERFSRRFSWRSREGAAWFDPNVRKHKLFPYWREAKELWRVISRSPLVWQERLRCYSAVLQWIRYHKYSLLDDLAYYPRQWGCRAFTRINFSPNSLGTEKAEDNVRAATDGNGAQALRSGPDPLVTEAVEKR